MFRSVVHAHILLLLDQCVLRLNNFVPGLFYTPTTALHGIEMIGPYVRRRQCEPSEAVTP